VIDQVSIADILRLPPLAQARVVGGHDGLARSVRAVNVMEVPDILDWVQPDELLLTTAYPLRGDPEALDALVPRLAERGLAGIAVKPARYIESIPAAMIAAADRHAFPLIELPADAAFNEIIQAVLTVILDTQAARLERSAAIHDRFTRIVLSGGGLRQIAEALAEFVGRPVSIVDAQGVVAWRTSDDAPGPGAGGADGAIGVADARADVASAIVQPIQVGGDHYGTILVAADGRPLSPDRLESIEYAATVAALRQVQARAVAEADRRFQAVCLEELVTGHVTDRSVLMERATAFAWDLATPRAVVLAEAEATAGRPVSSLAGTAEEASMRSRLAEAARAGLGGAAIVWERSHEIGALVPASDPQALREAGAALRSEAARRLPGVAVGIGIGRAAPDPLDLHASFAEARRALAIGRWGHGPGGLTVFEDLGVDRLLVSVPDGEIGAFCDAVLGRLEAYDAARGTSLVATLETFLASRNAALAARQLYLHYNTLKNRLDRIEEVIGPYLDDPDRCLSLALALRLRRLPGPFATDRAAGPG
jgi:PucR family transcriptional regulator, purine catabolism regulatory protein